MGFLGDFGGKGKDI